MCVLIYINTYMYYCRHWLHYQHRYISPLGAIAYIIVVIFSMCYAINIPMIIIIIFIIDST